MHLKAFTDINEPKVLTGLNEQELLGLCAQLVGSSTVVAPKVIFRTRNYLKGGRNRNKSTVKICKGDLCLSTTAAFCVAVSFPAAELFIRFFPPQ